MNDIMRKIAGALAVAIATAALAESALAGQRGHHRSYERERHEVFRGDIHRFHERDLGLWRSGRWHHGNHLGRSGWWWIVAGSWYFYPAPSYPYPHPYSPPVGLAPQPAASAYWYYCARPAGYYPYVPRCSRPWQRVPATPR